MTDKELFKQIFDRIAGRTAITMDGELVYYKGEPMFNTDGYNLAYNLHRLTNLMEDIGEFM